MIIGIFGDVNWIVRLLRLTFRLPWLITDTYIINLLFLQLTHEEHLNQAIVIRLVSVFC